MELMQKLMKTTRESQKMCWNKYLCKGRFKLGIQGIKEAVKENNGIGEMALHDKETDKSAKTIKWSFGLRRGNENAHTHQYQPTNTYLLHSACQKEG